MSTIGTVELIATIDTSQYRKGANEIDKANKSIEDSAGATSKKSSDLFSSIAKVGLAAVAGAAVAAGAAIVKNVGNAISRVDTLNNSARVFENMGFAGDVVKESMTALEKSIRGLPTPLDSAVRGMTSLAATYGDVGAGQRVFTALNNAIIGFGGTAAEVDNAIQQISQLPMDGPLDAQTWNSLRNSGLTPVLVAMSKEMGLSVNKMKEKFGEGELTVKDFINSLVKLDREGGGGMKSLEKIARDATSGIGTSFANMNTAIARGLGNVIKAIGTKEIADSINAVGTAFETALNQSSPFIKFLKDNREIFTAISITVGTLIGLMTSWFIATKVLAAGQAVLNAVLSANPIGLLVVSIISLAAGFIFLWNNVKSFRDFFIDAWKTITTATDESVRFISSVWGDISSTATEAWGNVKNTVSDAIDGIKSTTSSVFGAITGWIDDNKQAIINWSIVIGTILLPKILQIGIHATVAAAQTVAAYAVMAAGAIKNAFITSGAWAVSAIKTAFVWTVTTLPQIIAGFVVASASAVVNAVKISAAFVLSSAQTLIAWGIAFAQMVAGFVLMGVQALIAGGKMALGMLLALGPIGLVVAAVAGATALIIANWGAVSKFVGDVWSNLARWGQEAWNNIKAVFSGVGAFFSDVWRNVVNIFGRAGTAVGDAIGGAFKGVINSVLNRAVSIINGFISAINVAVDVINNIPGVDIGRLSTLSVPQLAEGGIVRARSGGVIANLAEAGQDEAVIPLNRLDSILNNEGKGNASNITISIDMKGIMSRSKADERDIAKNLIARINEELRAKGQPAIGGGAL